MEGIQNNQTLQTAGTPPPTDHANRQNSPIVTVLPEHQRIVPAELTRVQVLSNASVPAASIGSWVIYVRRHAAGQVRATEQWQQMENAQAPVSISAKVVITLPAETAQIRLLDGNGHPSHYPLNTGNFQKRYGTSLWNVVRQHSWPGFGSLPPEIVDRFAHYATKDALVALAGVNRRYYDTVVSRLNAVAKALLLARGEAILSTSGELVRLPEPRMTGEQFTNALNFIKTLSFAHQQKPLQKLSEAAMTQMEFGLIFDHLRNHGRLQNIPLPEYVADLPLSPAAKRAVEMFALRISDGRVVYDDDGDSPLEYYLPDQREELVIAYANLMLGVDGMAVPHTLIGNAQHQGNLLLTVPIYESLHTSIRQSIQESLPTYDDRMRWSDNFASGIWRMVPPDLE
jgi:hypothetical protein